MAESLNRIVAESIRNRPNMRTQTLLGLLESLERNGSYLSGEIRPLPLEAGLGSIFTNKLGLPPFVAGKKASEWIIPPVEINSTNPGRPDPVIPVFVFGRGGME